MSSITLQVVPKDVTKFKLTIAADRAELKIPLALVGSPEAARYEAFAQRVLAAVLADGPITKTLRGKIAESNGRPMLHVSLGGDPRHYTEFDV